MTAPQDNHVILELWEAAETAVRAAAGRSPADASLSSLAKAATVAVLRRLDKEIELAEEDDVVWPESGDLLILAGELEES